MFFSCIHDVRKLGSQWIRESLIWIWNGYGELFRFCAGLTNTNHESLSYTGEWDLSRCCNSAIWLLIAEADLRNVPLLCRPRIRCQRYKFHALNRACSQVRAASLYRAGGILDKYKYCLPPIRDTIAKEIFIEHRRNDSGDFFGDFSVSLWALKQARTPQRDHSETISEPCAI